MIQLSIDELLAQWADVEAAVDATEGIDPWCSGLDWVVPVASGFAANGKRLLLRSADDNGYAILGYYRRGGRIFLAGIEPLWGFASPIFGPDPAALAGELRRFLANRPDWSMLALAGLPPHPHPLTSAISAQLRPLGPTLLTDGITRRVADLSKGYETWLRARSRRFRRNLRQAEARAVDDGVTVVDAAQDDNLFERLLDIEQYSWKGQDNTGITTPEMSVMYSMMIDRLRERDRLQVFVAHLADSTEAGYILGGIRNRRYRGLQISFSAHHRSLSIGNLLQNHQIRHLTDHDLADVYDMGMDFDYKQRWADQAHSSVTLILHRSSTLGPLS
ncbi:MAG: GNAT family N-acetyltransferase [Acidimicrobiia bacterium]|nr:GNAT family N-acetyltransferase [Acidimicrobiia bacterium]